MHRQSKLPSVLKQSILSIGAICILTNCSSAPPTGEQSTNTDSNYLVVNGTWPNGTVPVCWGDLTGPDRISHPGETAQDASLQILPGNSEFADWAARIRYMLQDSWGRVANLQLTGWNNCPSNVSGMMPIKIFHSPNAGIRSGVMRLGIDRADFRAVTLHEGGHVFFGAPDPGPTTCASADGDSIMQSTGYCAGNGRTDLSARDIVDARGAYGPRHVVTCQELSDTYGIDHNVTYGFAPAAIRTQWTNLSCNTTSSSPDKCQLASDFYGISAGQTFGFAPTEVQTWWSAQNCTTKPLQSTSACQRAADNYGIMHNYTFGSAPSDVQTWWTQNNCTAKFRSPESCQNLSDLYGIQGGVDFGWASSEVQTIWTKSGCGTSPINTNRCQLLSDLYGMSAGNSSFATSEATSFWNSHSCSTSPASANNCQRASELYNIVAWSTFGFAPSSVQTWWNQQGCNTKPRNSALCKTAANRYGIVANQTWGLAPSAVQTWWSAASCAERSE